MPTIMRTTIRSPDPAVTERVSSMAEGLWHVAVDQARRIGRRLVAWYVHTPPADRVTWGGMTACAGLGLGVLLERLVPTPKAQDCSSGIHGPVP